MDKLKKNELGSLLEHFSIERKPYLFVPINDGLINDTYRVLDQDTSVYILQRINHNTFKDIEGLMSNVKNALQYLKDTDYAPISLVRTKWGKPYFEDAEKGFWRLMTYIDQSTAHNTAENEKIAFEAGRIVGKFHTLLQYAPKTAFVETIPDFHNLRVREVQFEQAVVSAKKEALEKARGAIACAKDTFPLFSDLSTGDLPVRICHNDTKLNNILFSKVTDKSLCLIDLDTVMTGHFYYDFGDAVRTIVNPAKEDERQHGKISFDRRFFEAFLDGLSLNGSFLTAREIELLPLGAAFMPFIHGLRALTDYLDGNRYYKVTYENQNLDRCLSLFNFTQKTLVLLDYMKIRTAEKLGR
ncbi:aminoglycoside phosphotransferase family protein [Flavobacteriaceae bacterium 3-367]